MSSCFTLHRYIAESFNIPVLVTNQITTKMSHDQPDGELEEVIERGVVTAALGNSWSHCVNTRLLLQYKEEEKRIVSLSVYILIGIKSLFPAII